MWGPGQAEDEAVVLAVVPPVEAGLAPVAAERVQPVPEDGEARPPVRQDDLHASLLPRPAAAQVEEEDGDDLVPGDGVELHGAAAGGVEGGQAAADIADTPQAGEGRLDHGDLGWWQRRLGGGQAAGGVTSPPGTAVAAGEVGLGVVTLPITDNLQQTSRHDPLDSLLWSNAISQNNIKLWWWNIKADAGRLSGSPGW